MIIYHIYDYTQQIFCRGEKKTSIAKFLLSQIAQSGDKSIGTIFFVVIILFSFHREIRTRRWRSVKTEQKARFEGWYALS